MDPIFNADLMLRVAAHIEKHPEQYDQEEWMVKDFGPIEHGEKCGTYGCIAGWACELATDKDKERFKGYDEHTTESYSGAARILLGLTYSEARKLFDSEFTPPCGMDVPQFLRAFVQEKENKDVSE